MAKNNPSKKMRQFKTGATRHSDEGKFDYEGFLSPQVLERFAAYMNVHRKQADGKLRDSDNWQRGFGEDNQSVCIKSAFRHFMSWWKAHRGLKTEEDIEESICALMFNAMAYLHGRLKKKLDS